MPPAPRPKLVQALGDPATAPAELTITPLGDDPSVSELIRHALSTSVDRLLAPRRRHALRRRPRGRPPVPRRGPHPALQPQDVRARARPGMGRRAAHRTGLARHRSRPRARPRHPRASACTASDPNASAPTTAAAAELLLAAHHRRGRAGPPARPGRFCDATATTACSTPSSKPPRPRRSPTRPRVDVPAGDFLRRVARKQVRRLHRTVAALSDPPTDHEAAPRPHPSQTHPLRHRSGPPGHRSARRPPRRRTRPPARRPRRPARLHRRRAMAPPNRPRPTHHSPRRRATHRRRVRRTGPPAPPATRWLARRRQQKTPPLAVSEPTDTAPRTPVNSHALVECAGG